VYLKTKVKIEKSSQFKFIAPYYRISFLSVYIGIYVPTILYISIHPCPCTDVQMRCTFSQTQGHTRILFAYAVTEDQNVWFLHNDLVRIITSGN